MHAHRTDGWIRKRSTPNRSHMNTCDQTTFFNDEVKNRRFVDRGKVYSCHIFLLLFPLKMLVWQCTWTSGVHERTQMYAGGKCIGENKSEK